MKTCHLPAILILLPLLLLRCEQQGDDPQTPFLEILSPTDISETGFILHWRLNHPGNVRTLVLEISRDSEFGQLVFTRNLDDTGMEYLEIKGLRGAVQYYYRFHLMNDTDTLHTSEAARVETSYMQQSLKLVTSDSFELSANMAFLESLQGQRPGVILMHEFGVWINPWIGSDLLKRLVSEGYICLTFFFRGHGTSTPVDDLNDLLANREMLARDLQAALDHMILNEERCSGELALVGGSMGAIMALAGNGYDEVLTSVALSPVRDGVHTIFPEMTLRSVYYMAGELDVHPDRNVDFPAEAKALYKMTEEPRKLDIIPGTPDHGSNLLGRDSLVLSVADWILEQLPLPADLFVP